MPKVSVVIPSYNHAHFIGEAVQSVLNQTEPDLEVIIVDDGSTDESLEVLSSFSDRRVRVISQTNRGAHAAINRGLGESSGKFLAILNSDDAYDPLRLEKAIRVLEKKPQVGLVGSYIEIVDDQNRPLGIKHGYRDCSPWLLEVPERSFRAGSDLRLALLTENYWATTSNYVFPRSWYDLVGELRPLRYAHDWDFALRMANVAEIELLPEPLLRYRVHQSNTIRENYIAMIFEICWCLAVHLPTHSAQMKFFNDSNKPILIDRLLYSIYTYHLDRVLSVMLLQKLDENLEDAMDLLNPEDPARQKYLSFIQRIVNQQSENRPRSSQSAPENFQGITSPRRFGLLVERLKSAFKQ